VSSAVQREIEAEMRNAPETRVLLIAFSDEVTIYGDGYVCVLVCVLYAVV
jgi:hypothetical protein